MSYKNHTIRSAVLLSFLVLAALLGSAALPASADDGSSASLSQSVMGSLSGAKPKSHSASRAKYHKGDPRRLGAKIFKGQAFDICRAPSATVMRAWGRTSPFGAVGVYVGGRARACPNQAHLNRPWVHAVDNMGWKLIPVYVGSQSPCVRAGNKRGAAMSYYRPAQRGGTEGRDAVRQAKKLGMAAHSAIYLDMESYRNTETRCAITTLRFIQGWNRALRKASYIPGFYSSADSGIQHMEGARKAGRHDLPEMLWFARWKVPGSLNNERYLDNRAWQPHRRIHQYDGDVTRTYGGYSMSIDRNVMDAPVAIVK